MHMHFSFIQYIVCAGLVLRLVLHSCIYFRLQSYWTKQVSVICEIVNVCWHVLACDSVSRCVW